MFLEVTSFRHRRKKCSLVHRILRRHCFQAIAILFLNDFWSPRDDHSPLVSGQFSNPRFYPAVGIFWSIRLILPTIGRRIYPHFFHRCCELHNKRQLLQVRIWSSRPSFDSGRWTCLEVSLLPVPSNLGFLPFECWRRLLMLWMVMRSLILTREVLDKWLHLQFCREPRCPLCFFFPGRRKDDWVTTFSK